MLPLEDIASFLDHRADIGSAGFARGASIAQQVYTPRTQLRGNERQSSQPCAAVVACALVCQDTLEEWMAAGQKTLEHRPNAQLQAKKQIRLWHFLPS